MCQRQIVLGMLAASMVGLAGCNVRIGTVPTPPQVAPVSRPLDSEGWNVLFTDDFDRDEVGESWRPTIGEWTIEDGALKGVLVRDRSVPFEFHCADIVLDGPALPETVEIRYESWSPDEVGSEGKLLNAESHQGIIIALYGTAHPAIGSTGAVIFLQRAADRFDLAASNPAFKFPPGNRQRVRIVRQPEGVTVFVDDKPIVSAAIGEQPESLEKHLHLVGTFGKAGSVVHFDNLEILVPPAEEEVPE